MKNLNTKSICSMLSVILFLFVACNKPRFKACYTTAKDTFSVGETIWFYNCSDFDGALSTNINSWLFEPTQDSLIVSSGHDSMSWVYLSPGIKNPKLTTGHKENADAISKTIIVQ